MSSESATPWDIAPQVEAVRLEDISLLRPVMPHEACDRCKGTGGIPIGPALMPGEVQHDECPDCIGTGRSGEARFRQELADERYEEWWA